MLAELRLRPAALMASWPESLCTTSVHPDTRGPLLRSYTETFAPCCCNRTAVTRPRGCIVSALSNTVLQAGQDTWSTVRFGIAGKQCNCLCHVAVRKLCLLRNSSGQHSCAQRCMVNVAPLVTHLVKTLSTPCSDCACDTGTFWSKSRSCARADGLTHHVGQMG